MLINSLICDNNYTTAIFYCQILFKVLNVFFKIILKKKLPKKYYLKFLEFTGINFLFTGICLEQNEIIYNNETCYYVYKQANYFLGLIDPKGKFNYIPKPNTTQQNDENRALILSQIILEKYKVIANYFGKI